MSDFEVDLPSLEKVPEMFERLSESSLSCGNYAGEAFAGTTGSSLISGTTRAIPSLPTIDLGRGGIINILAGTHNRIARDVIARVS